MSHQRIAVAGAGGIGCFMGGLLMRAGFDVRFLGRLRLIGALAAQCLRFTDYAGLDVRLDSVNVTEAMGA